ncbi:MAG TPA: phosphodiester glycosidase family protein [Rhodanobacteraceae bacterium]|nr:phosphodiester glycosidase family protein [Rhodanobacteraceae bacterium]
MRPLRPLASRLASLLGKAGLITAAASLAACAQTSHGIASHDVRFDDVHFRVVTLDLHKANLSLHWRNPATGKPFASIHALQAWGAAHHRALLFAANAGIYDAKGEPLGLYVEGGKARKPLNTAHGNPAAGNFSLLPNGVFVIDATGHASVQTTTEFAAAQLQPRTATQSGPMLVIDGKLNPHFDSASDSMKWRSGVCARNPDDVVFAVSASPVNFHTFAALFRDRLGCANALYLDGTLSQIYVDGEYYGAPAFMVKPYAGIFAVFVPTRAR